ncbi:MAG: hypothetical protein PWP27_1367 [Clostridiales bacterium]|jgi:hypothetical protein|nr:hypothetical protein [Clostridiales bacterium]MDK2933557.1 hypothetical protein [Clostridiales bacterium]
MKLQNSKLLSKLEVKNISVTLEHILDNSKANSGGEKDVNFLKKLVADETLLLTQAILKRTALDINEEYYLERYKKINFETDQHFLCRTIIQDELKRMGIDTDHSVSVGDMNILHTNSNYDIVTDDFSVLIDVGLTPARNYFRGLTDLRVKNYLITTYFDDYIDDIIFAVFTRANDERFVQAVKHYEMHAGVYSTQDVSQQLYSQTVSHHQVDQ